MKFQYKFILLLLLILSLINIASAWEWDNVKSYDDETKEVTIVNALYLGSDIAKIKLLTEQNVYAIPGKDRKVAEMELWFNPDFNEQYDTQFKEAALIDTYDIGKEMNSLGREIKMKYASKTETRYNTEYEKVCIDKGAVSLNGSKILDCEWKLTKNQSYEVVLEWTEFNELSKLPNPARIGLFADVYYGDKVEWVPEFFGVRIDEWAEWTSSFNVDLRFYYSFNKSQSIEDNRVNVSYGNMTYAAAKVPVIGKYENGTHIIPNNYMVTGQGIGGSNSTINSTEGTINFWINWTWQPTATTGFFMIDDESLFVPSFIVYADTRATTGQPGNLRYDLIFNMDTNGQDFALLTYNNSLWAINGSGYHMLTLNHNGTGLEWYLDGAKQTDNYFVGVGKAAWFRKLVDDGAYKMSFDTRGLGGYARGNLDVDEFGLWNRSLTDDEITDLYNAGTGIFYTPDATPIEQEDIFVYLRVPEDNLNTLQQITNFTANVTTTGQVNITNATLQVWDSSHTAQITSYQTISGTNTTNITYFLSTTTLTNGTFLWNVFGCGYNATSGMCKYSASNRTFIIDTINPTLSIITPRGIITRHTVGKNLTLNWSFIEVHPNGCKYYYAGVNHTVQCWRNTTLLNITGTEKTVLFYMNDTHGNYITNTSSWDYAFIEYNYTYNSTAFDTTTEFYSILIYYNTTIYPTFTGYFVYSNVSQLASSRTVGNYYEFYSSKYIPPTTVFQTNSFYWNFLAVNTSSTTGINSTFLGQSINVTNASLFNVTYKVPFINFSIIDQETLLPMNTTFDGTLYYGLSNTLGKNLSYSTALLNRSLYSFAFYPEFKSFYVEGLASFSNPLYVTKAYTLPNQIFTNQTTTINIYMMNDSLDTEFIIYVRDSSYASVPNAEVHIERYYPGTNTWVEVGIVTTNDEGKTVETFILSSVNYRFKVYLNSILQHTTSATKMICEATPCTITITLPSEAPGLDAFPELDNLETDLTWDSSTDTFAFTYVDANSTAKGGHLIVERVSATLPSTIVCNNSNGNPSSIITCDISLYPNGTYIASGYINRTGDENHLVERLMVQKTFNIADEVGVDGLFWGAIFIIGFVMLGLFKPILAILFAVIGVLGIFWLGIVSIGYITIFAIIIIALILVWEMKR